jgi:ribosomal protein L37AE/L43A
MYIDFIKIVKDRDARLLVCSTCEFKTVKFEVDICSKCKCLLRGKASLPLAKCPEDKWDKI